MKILKRHSSGRAAVMLLMLLLTTATAEAETRTFLFSIKEVVENDNQDGSVTFGCEEMMGDHYELLPETYTATVPKITHTFQMSLGDISFCLDAGESYVNVNTINVDSDSEPTEESFGYDQWL